MKILFIINFTTKLLSIKYYFLNGTNRKIIKKFTKKFDSKVINRQYFHRKTGLKTVDNHCVLRAWKSYNVDSRGKTYVFKSKIA